MMLSTLRDTEEDAADTDPVTKFVTQETMQASDSALVSDKAADKVESRPHGMN